MSLFDNVRPRQDGLEGTISDAVFAANLDDVVSGAAPDAYGPDAEAAEQLALGFGERVTVAPSAGR